MTSAEIRSIFLQFFKDKGHQIVPSAPLVIHNDPTLMFTNAGMNPFKDIFLGNEPAKYLRIADTQKCLRVSGKHNDLEEVGIDTYHHTLFEMLGNWSFGDYFKKDAIDWAWELLTKRYLLPEDRLYVTVFGGDEKEQLQPDIEAKELWKNHVIEDRILFGSKKDNFWEMGESGPCGPCSEIHIDLRSDSEIEKLGGKELVNTGHPQVIEIWNLVFMEFNRLASGQLQPLPAKHVDTGMGFERLTMAIQQKTSNYDTDIFTPTLHYLATKTHIPYGQQESTDIAMRVIADHIRAVAFTIADGQLPSNAKAGYVIRRILRRAVRYGYTYLGLKEPFMHELVQLLAQQFGTTFPEIDHQKEFVARVIREEELSFLRTLESGLKRLDIVLKDQEQIDGKTAFELYDTFGFPFDLTQLIARERKVSIDEKGFEEELKIQKERSKDASKKLSGDWILVHEIDKVQFVGYDRLDCQSLVHKYRWVEEKGQKWVQLVLEQTPFYAESGGQIGDTGFIENETGKYAVIDTKKENDLIIHILKHLPQSIESTFKCRVDSIKRQLTQYNHSATHLLHAALREILGNHVQQKGSLVNDQALRFDFSHFTKVSDEELEKIENRVNEKIHEGIILDEKRDVPIEIAKQMGAMALFGEKYGDHVRVITFDPSYSVELCGGTHAKNTAQIGLFKIISESSVAAGVRRIEALTALGTQNWVKRQSHQIETIKEKLKNPKDWIQSIEQLMDDKATLNQKIERYQQYWIQETKKQLKSSINVVENVNSIVTFVDAEDAEVIKKLSFEMKNEISNLFLVLAAIIDHKPMVSIMISDNLVSEKSLHAGNIVRELAKCIDGGGGGQAFYATAGGKNKEGIDELIQQAKRIIQ